MVDEMPGSESTRESESLSDDLGATGESWPALSRSALVTLTTAARKWDLPPELTETLVNRLTKIVQDERTTTRTLLSIARVCHALNGQDQGVSPRPTNPAVAVSVNVSGTQPTGEERRAMTIVDEMLRRQDRGRIADATDC